MKINFIFTLLVLLSLFYSKIHTAEARVGDTYYCEKTGGRVLLNDGVSYDLLALLKKERRPVAFLVEHTQTSLRVKTLNYTEDYDILLDNRGTDVRSISIDKQSHLVIWLQGKDGYSFTLTHSSPSDLKAEVGFCKMFN